MTSGVYIGALSGTSMDALDVAAVRFSSRAHAQVRTELLACANEAIPESLRESIFRLQRGNAVTAGQARDESHVLGQLFADAISRVTLKLPEDKNVLAIGLHGQTVLHRPDSDPPFTLQIGDPGVVAEQTRYPVVSDFRQSDLAAGGQGAPLAPAFHSAFFAEADTVRAVVNIGGIANVTVLDGSNNYSGFDCGPGNILLDSWARRCLDKAYDHLGAWAESGICNKALLARLLDDEFFTRAPPKSTCTSHFNLAWLEQKIAGEKISLENIQTTLTELTARCIADAVTSSTSRLHLEHVFICGGGVHNHFLVKRLKALLEAPVTDTRAMGLSPDWVEAAGFAYLAKRFLNNEKTDLQNVTGAREAVTLGEIYGAARAISTNSSP